MFQFHEDTNTAYGHFQKNICSKRKQRNKNIFYEAIMDNTITGKSTSNVHVRLGRTNSVLNELKLSFAYKYGFAFVQIIHFGAIVPKRLSSWPVTQ